MFLLLNKEKSFEKAGYPFQKKPCRTIGTKLTPEKVVLHAASGHELIRKKPVLIL